MNLRFRQPREKDPAHLSFLRELICVICASNIYIDAAHIRFSDAAAGKINPGVGQKPDDRWALPLCRTHHDEQHKAGDEPGWWEGEGIDPLSLAIELYANTGDHEACEQIIRAQREFV